MSKSQPKAPHLAKAIERNIKALRELKKERDSKRSVQDAVADFITGFSGNLNFIYVHVVWFGIWIPWNMNMLGFTPFDPYPFGLLTMIVSLEAIFLSTFVLISQNRMMTASDKRAELDLHINLIAEHEITKILKLTDSIADHLGLKEGADPELEELERNISPTDILLEIERS